MGKRTAAIVSALLFCAAEGLWLGRARAATINVPLDYPTVQAAIDAARDGDQIVVSPGRYAEKIQIKNKNIVLRSWTPNNPHNVAATILDGTKLDSAVVIFGGEETTSCVLTGFTITNADVGYYPSGAITGKGCRATIKLNRMVENKMPVLWDCDGLIERNLILSNTCYDNNVIFDCNGVIRRNIIANNTSFGPTIDLMPSELSPPSGVFLNNTVYGNRSDSTTILLDSRLPPNRFVNCIFWGNDPPLSAVLQPAMIGNTPPRNLPVGCCIQDWPLNGNGNFSADPQFVDPNNGNFHLKSTSPCIDSGLPDDRAGTDLDGNSIAYDTLPMNLNGSDRDVGAYEYVGLPPEITPPEAPTNLDPPNGTNDLSRAPTFLASPMVDPDPNSSLLAARWQINTQPEFDSPFFDTVRFTSQPRQYLLDFPLDIGVRYYWRVQYLDNTHSWGAWSTPTSFQIRRTGIIVVPWDVPTVQKGIDLAWDGDQVVVMPGTYRENLVFYRDGVTLRSLFPNDTQTVKETVIDGSSADHTLTLKNTAGPNSTVMGLTITGGGTNAINAVISGPGIMSEGSLATIENCRIIGNEGKALDFLHVLAFGAGVYGHAGVIRNTLIAYNKGLGFNFRGSGLAYCTGPIINCVVFGNRAEYAQGYYVLYRCSGPLVNTIIWGNGPYGTIYPADNSTTPAFCIHDFPLPAGYGNLLADPRIVDPSGPDGDFHLRPDSPCIDAGEYIEGLTTDFEGDPRPVPIFDDFRGDGSTFDIGMDEFIPNPPVLEPILRKILKVEPIAAGGDQNQDGSVDIADWIAFRRGSR